MRLASLWVFSVMALACTAGGGNRSDAGPRDGGGGGMDAGRDAGPETCSSDPDCDDGFGCTIDSCVVGNVCEHTPLDSRCNAAANETCVVGRGCVVGLPTDCTVSADCDDGMYCNGPEQCLGNRCYMALERDVPSCDDGNACTLDACDEAMDGCARELAPGCDGGTGPGFDAGPPCPAFMAPAHFAGTYRMLPGQACDSGLGGGYSINNVTFSISGGMLVVDAGPFRLTQSPVPTGASFDVSGSTACANVRLAGMFECQDRFRATWTANHTGCSCMPTNATVVGRRN